MTGYRYDEREPKERCPYCNALCVADFVDIGIGFQQCGPYHCERCGASEIHPNDDQDQLTENEKKIGWYEPGKDPSPLANTDENGNIITHYEADTLYRAKKGVPPRYDKYGNFLKE